MAKDLWLPKGHKLTDGSRVGSLLFASDDWQVFDTDGADNILLAHPQLVQKWVGCGLLEESLLGGITFGPTSFRILSSRKKYALTTVENWQGPDKKVDAISFAVALKTSRKLSGDASFHDALYVEQYSRLLPTWTLTPRVDDEVVLGTWMTGGVVIPISSFRRLRNLTGWMPPGSLEDIIEAAGLSVPAEAGILTKRKPKSRTDSIEKMAEIKSDTHQEQPQARTDKIKRQTFTLPGRPHLEEFFNEHVIDIIFNARKYQDLGIEFPSAIVLHGPPGCGKTFAVERLVEFIDWPSYSIDSSSVGSPYIHATSKKISEVFDQAIDNAPAVIVIDEMEAFLPDRSSMGVSGSHHIEEVAEFLRRIPEAIKNKVLIIAMTNLIDRIDPAILRRGRFDHVIGVGMPSRIEVAALLESLLAKLPKVDVLNMDTTLDTLTGKALSDSAFVVREAARLAAKAGQSRIAQEHLEAALRSLPAERNTSRPIGFTKDS